MKKCPPGLKFNPKEIVQQSRSGSVGKYLILSALVLPLCWGLSAGATPVVPTGYTATPGEGIAQGGFYNYFDETGSQLIDENFGADDWTANLGNGIAYEWVGWRVANPVITFQFSGPVTITQVGIDFNRTESSMIFLPNTVSLGSTDFAVAPDAIPDASHGMLFFNGLWTGASLTVILTDCSPSHWTFVDEISFSVEAVPEPSVFMLVAIGIGCVALRLKRAGVAS